MGRFKQVFTNFRVIILIIFLVLALVSIMPNPWNEGAAIRSVTFNSSASIAGIQSPNPRHSLMSREVIQEINGNPVKNVEDYYRLVSQFQPNRTYTIKTNVGLYRLTTEYGENNSLQDIGIMVTDPPKTNIRKGLDLQGGTRVLLQPEKRISPSDMSVLIDNMVERLNVYGLSDVVVREASDLSGNQYIAVEVAGVNEEEVKDLISKQGKFEATIGNATVFSGGKDITYVCRTAECAGIDPSAGCGQAQDRTWYCRFRFQISLTPEAAQKQANLTKDLEVTGASNDRYLSEPIVLYLDDKEVDSLNIAADLKGVAATNILISGSGVGTSRDEATNDALTNMKKLQTVLITGSLPVKLDVVKADTISPVLGETFIKNALIIGLSSILAVGVVIFIRYRRWQVSVPIIFTMMSEVVLLLGMAALIGWNIDIAAIAGIIVAVGTGVDDQVVITDETMGGKRDKNSSWKSQLKKAFFIIMAAYFATVVAMLPLLFAGAGLLKGFALTTILGVTFGVFITRPAYAAVVEILVRE
jgi:preprotein translocase subunit SecD